MSDILINNKVGSEKQLLFLNKTRVIGVQSLSTNQFFALAPVSYGGIESNTIRFSPQTEQNCSMSLNSLFINQDFYYSLFTGEQLFNAYIFKETSDLNTCFSILSGYFTDYSCSYSIGNVPSLSINGIFLKNAGIISTGSMSWDQIDDLNYISTGNHNVTEFLIPYGNNISLNVSEFTTNRVQSFEIRLNRDKNPIYKMGQKNPTRIDYNSPINVQCNFTFDVGDYQNQILRNSIQNGIIKNLTFHLADYQTSGLIASYSFDHLNLISEETTVTSNDILTVNWILQGRFYP